MHGTCPDRANCEFFTSVYSRPILRVKYATMYPFCNSGKHESCMRWWLMQEGKDVPSDLLPDGGRDVFAEETHRPVHQAVQRVLVVDDMPLFRKAVANLVVSACQGPVEVVEADSGEQAVEALGRSTDWIAVVTDFNMGEMSGLDLIRVMRSSPAYSHVPAIVFSSESNAAAQASCSAMPLVRWLSKRPDQAVFDEAWRALVIDKKA